MTVMSENCFIINFKEKPELFNSFFSNECSSLKTAVNFLQTPDTQLIRDYVQLTSQLIIKKKLS